MDGRMTTDTVTLTFQSRDGDPVYTTDVIARPPPKEPVEDAAPEMTPRLDGETVLLVTRLHSKRL